MMYWLQGSGMKYAEVGPIWTDVLGIVECRPASVIDDSFVSLNSGTSEKWDYIGKGVVLREVWF
jgi:hypothetical protein